MPPVGVVAPAVPRLLCPANPRFDSLSICVPADPATPPPPQVAEEVETQLQKYKAAVDEINAKAAASGQQVWPGGDVVTQGASRGQECQ